MLGILADGVGFDSNIAGLTGLLTQADEFFQLATLWKGAVLAASVTGVKLMVVLPDATDHKNFLTKYAKAVSVVPKIDKKPGWVEAGEGLMRPA